MTENTDHYDLHVHTRHRLGQSEPAGKYENQRSFKVQFYRDPTLHGTK